MKYSSEAVGVTSSSRTGITGRPWFTARSTSRLICGEVLALADSRSTKIFASAIACTIAAPHSWPGRMSRGAIQQRMPCASSTAQVASAAGLSFDE